MALSRSMRAYLHTGRLAAVAMLVSGGIVLHFLACILYNNWWPMLTVLMYLLLTMPVILFLGSDSSAMMPNENDVWVNFTKFLTGASIVGSIAIPSILKHAGIIGWGALTMELSSFGIFGLAILWYLQMNREEMNREEDEEEMNREEDECRWVNFTKFLTGASIVGSIVIPSILKYAGIIGWGALTMELSSFGVFGLAILWYLQMNREEDEYSSIF